MWLNINIIVMADTGRSETDSESEWESDTQLVPDWELVIRETESLTLRLSEADGALTVQLKSQFSLWVSVTVTLTVSVNCDHWSVTVTVNAVHLELVTYISY